MVTSNILIQRAMPITGTALESLQGTISRNKSDALRLSLEFAIKFHKSDGSEFSF